MTLLRLPRKHARTHLPGGSDPIETSSDPQMTYARLSDSGHNGITGDVDEFVYDSGSSYSEWDPDGDTFADYTDSDSVRGIEFLKTGMYHCEWATAFTWNDNATNPTHLVPPFVAMYIQVIGSSTHFNTADPLTFNVGAQAEWVSNGEHPILGTNQTTEAHAYIRIGGTYTLTVASVPSKATIRITSHGAAHKWSYSGSLSLTYFRIYRLGKFV